MKKTLIILGTHPNGLVTFDWSRKDCEIWMFNEAPNAKKENGELIFPRCDVCFQLHHEAIWKNPKNRSDTKHYDWLRSGKTPTMYMQKHYSDIPKSVKYPIDRVLSLTKNTEIVIKEKSEKISYFSSSPDFAFALIADMWKRGQRYDHIEVHGIELETESEYRYQKTGFGFWIGYLTALGVKIILYNQIFNAPIYGYEGDVAISTEQIEKRIAELTQELGDQKNQYNEDAKIFLDSLSGLLRQDISASIQKELNELIKRNENAGILNGRIKESKRYLEKAIGMKEKAGTSVFSMGEFDGSRVSNNKQYAKVQAEAFNLNANLNLYLKRLLNLKKGSQKRQRALDEFGTMIADLMNKNMLLLHLAGSISENQYYIDSIKQSISIFKEGD